MVVGVGEEGRDVSIAFLHHLEDELEAHADVPPTELRDYCEDAHIQSYSYEHAELTFEHQY